QRVKGGSVLTFALDRIIKLWPTNKHFDAKNFDDAAYFRHALGITVPGDDPQEVRLRFTPQQGKYIKSQPIHPSQEIIQDTEDACEVKLHLVVNPELRMLLLSYGATLKVLAPESLVKDLAEEAGKMAALYK
ncbi:MAG TPA: WYL domain-containing protein, partial [Chitinophaga sp.]